MKSPKTNKNKFIASIITSMKMNVSDFMQNLTNGEKYECTIYEWSVNLFDEGKPLEEAIKTIHQRRMFLIFNTSYVFSSREEYLSMRNHQKIMEELDAISRYSDLNQKQKTSIQGKIDALIDSKLRTNSEVIELVLKIIEYNFKANIWKATTTNKPTNNTSPNKNELKFLSKFKNYIHPKITINETLLPSSQLS